MTAAHATWRAVATYCTVQVGGNVMNDFLVSDNTDSLWAVGVGQPAPDRYVLKVNPAFCVYQPTRPNAWFRFWQRVLLGWTWEEA